MIASIKTYERRTTETPVEIEHDLPFHDIEGEFAVSAAVVFPTSMCLFKNP
jgi:hypothetical protein